MGPRLKLVPRAYETHNPGLAESPVDREFVTGRTCIHAWIEKEEAEEFIVQICRLQLIAVIGKKHA